MDGRQTKAPSGRDILRILVELYADQENVTIEYEVEEMKCAS